MERTRTAEFRKEAVRIALTSRLTRRQIAADLGIGMSTLNKWVTEYRDMDVFRMRVTTLPVRMNGFARKTVFSRRSGTY